MANDIETLLLDKDFGTACRVRDELKKLPKDWKIKLSCFNEEEVQIIKSHLHPHEIERVIFTWLKFQDPRGQSK